MLACCAYSRDMVVHCGFVAATAAAGWHGRFLLGVGAGGRFLCFVMARAI
jgi:hypothetical protein